MLVAQLCPTRCDPIYYSPPGSSVHGNLQAIILERIAIVFSRESFQSRDGIQASCTAGRFFTLWATKPKKKKKKKKTQSKPAFYYYEIITSLNNDGDKIFLPQNSLFKFNILSHFE